MVREITLTTTEGEQGATAVTELIVTIDDETAATLRATAKKLNVSVEAAAAMVLTRYAKANHKAVVGVLEHADS